MHEYRTDCRCGRVEPDVTDRRGFLRRAGAGFGMLALADLLGRDRLLAGSPSPVLHYPTPPHFPPRPAPSSGCSWRAARGRWTHSTPSPS